MIKYLLIYLFIFSLPVKAAEITVGSKTFTESYILGELIAQILEERADLTVSRKFGLGGTGVLFEALNAGDIDIYAEYTGTIAEAILKKPHLKTTKEISEQLEKLDLVITAPLGFNNTYALAVPAPVAQKYDLEKMSDLVNFPDLTLAVSYEFMDREDGFYKMSSHYGFSFTDVKVMEHALSYEAAATGKADVLIVYTTDAKIKSLNLVVLKDDLNFFPEYNAVILARKEFAEGHPKAWSLLRATRRTIDAETMIGLNASVDIDKKSFAQAVSAHLGLEGSSGNPIYARVVKRTKEHLILVTLSVIFSICVGVPLGVMAVRSKHLGQSILLLSGVVQTIPSLALLCFLIPIFGIGVKPALFALCLYSLLPVVMGTFVGINGIDPTLNETAKAMGMSRWHRLILVELPLASHNIVAGVKTATIIGIGTATLAALIGAGGYGAPILTGLALNDMNTILLGAIPAAVMAIVAHALFDLLGRFVIPKGLRL